MFPPDGAQKNIVLRRSNELIEARYKLSIEEQRLVLLLSSLIHPNDEDFKSYEIRVADFAKMFSLEKRKAIYTEVETASERLTRKNIELSRDGKKIYAAWLSYVEYVEGSGIIKVEFHNSLKPYLLQLHKNFTQYRMNQVMSFKSTYSIRLYELLKMEVWKAEKANKSSFDRIFDLEEYRNLLGIDKKEYLAFDNFRRRVIEPTIKEISDTTDLNIFEVRYIRTGRKITGIHFIVLIRSEAETSAQVAQLQLGQTPKEKPTIHPVVQTLMDRGIAFEVAQSLMKKHGVKRIERSLSYLLGKEASGVTINDKIGYLMTAIRDDYGNAIEAQEQKKKEAIAKKKAEEEQKRRQEQEKAKRDEEQKQKTLKTIETFLTLPNGMKNLIKKGFLEVMQENPVKLERWNKTQKANDDSTIKNEPLIRGEFARYLIDNNFIE